MIRGLIFDFDGLILETEEPVFQSWCELYRSHGCELGFEEWATLIGTAEASFDPFQSLEQQVGRKLDRQDLLATRKQRERSLILTQPVRPGVADYLSQAKQLGIKRAVATSSNYGWVSSHLSRLGLLDSFDCIRSRDDVRHTKPDPELFLSALDCLGVHASEAIVFEDSPNGILAARRAGIFCVAVPNPLTRRLDLHLADLQLESLADLPLSELLEIAASRPSRNGGQHALESR